MKKCTGLIKDKFSRQISEKRPGEEFKFQINDLTKDESVNTEIESFQVGPHLIPFHWTLLIVGETGVGKTTLLNAIANSYYGVKFEDDVRFKLVNEQIRDRNPGESQTEKIKVYTLNPVEGLEVKRLSIDFALTLIDTPGFSFKEGALERNKELLDKIRGLVKGKSSSCLPKGPGSIDGIVFVVKASQTALTTEQSLIFEILQSLLDEKKKPISILVATFSGDGKTHAEEAVKKANIKLRHCLEVNNGTLYADNRPHSEAMSDVASGERLAFKQQQEVNEKFWEDAQAEYIGLFKVLKEHFGKASVMWKSQFTAVTEKIEEAKLKVESITGKLRDLEYKVYLIFEVEQDSVGEPNTPGSETRTRPSLREEFQLSSLRNLARHYDVNFENRNRNVLVIFKILQEYRDLWLELVTLLSVIEEHFKTLRESAVSHHEPVSVMAYIAELIEKEDLNRGNTKGLLLDIKDFTRTAFQEKKDIRFVDKYLKMIRKKQLNDEASGEWMMSKIRNNLRFVIQNPRLDYEWTIRRKLALEHMKTDIGVLPFRLICY